MWRNSTTSRQFPYFHAKWPLKNNRKTGANTSRHFLAQKNHRKTVEKPRKHTEIKPEHEKKNCVHSFSHSLLTNHLEGDRNLNTVAYNHFSSLITWVSIFSAFYDRFKNIMNFKCTIMEFICRKNHLINTEVTKLAKKATID